MTTWIIRSNQEVDDETNEPLYWSNTFGWSSRECAEIFTDGEMRSVNLPLGDSEWEEYHHVVPTYQKPL